MESDWRVDGTDLDTRHRRGGVIAIKGFDLQSAYALQRMTWLLTCREGLVELRYEGAQDLDLRLGSGAQCFVQVKGIEWKSMTPAKLYGVLAGFARDVLSARLSNCSEADLPTFKLVSTNPPNTTVGLKILSNPSAKGHVAKVVASMKPKYTSTLTKAMVEDAVEAALERTTSEVLGAEIVVENLRDMASWELARFGVPVEHVEATLALMAGLLRPRASLQMEDVASVMLGLPSGHPARPDTLACRLVPSRKEIEPRDQARTSFLEGDMTVLWAAVAHRLDVARPEASDVRKALLALRAPGGMAVVQGSMGSGKSTLARRIAWDLHRSGDFLALHVVNPGILGEDGWKAILRLRDLSRRPLLLVVDDVWRYGSFVEALDSKVRGHLCVLATSRPEERASMAPTRLRVQPIPLGPLGLPAVQALRNLVGYANGDLPSQGSLLTLLRNGQIFAASLVLQNGSLAEFALKLAEPLQSADGTQFEDFLDLCVVAMHDQSAPMHVLRRALRASRPFWEAAPYLHLALERNSTAQGRLRLGHALIAREVVKAFHADAVVRSLALCWHCKPESTEDRRFALRLLTNCVNDRELADACKSQAARIAHHLKRFEPHATFADLVRMSRILENVGDPTGAQHFARIANGGRFRGGDDIALAFARCDARSLPALLKAALAFYAGDETGYGRRRLLTTLMHLGTEGQKQTTLDAMADWLGRHEFPAEETRLVFDMCVYGSVALCQRALPLVAGYANAIDMPISTSLAALRLLRRVPERVVFGLLEERLVAALSASSPLLTSEQHVLTLMLGRLTRARLPTDGQIPLYKILLSMAAQDPGNLSFLSAVIHLAPADQGARLAPLVRGLRERSKSSKRSDNCIGLFQRRFPHVQLDLVGAAQAA